MNLLDRYISAVGSKIWGKNRKDIESELRSILLDALDEKTESREATEEDVAELLRDFGHPSEVAGRYNLDKKYIIGPELYDLYMLIIKIVCIAVPIGLTIGILVDIMQSQQLIDNLFWEIFLIVPKCFSALVSAVGLITIIFGLIEKTAVIKQEDLSLTNKDWDPRKLPEAVREHDEVKRYSKIIGILWIVLVLIILNFFSDKIGVYYGSGTGRGWSFVPIFSQGVLSKFVPLWSISLVMKLVLNMVLIKEGRWKKKTRIYNILILIADVIIFAMLISTPDFININTVFLKNPSLEQELLPAINIFEKFFKLGLIFIFIPMFVEIGKEIAALIKHWRAD